MAVRIALMMLLISYKRNISMIKFAVSKGILLTSN